MKKFDLFYIYLHRCPPAWSLLTAVGIILFSLPAAFGHAKLLATQPADKAVLPQAPKAVELSFSEGLQRVEMNSIVVTGGDNTTVSTGAAAVSADGKVLSVELPALAAGSYTIEWRALSGDDHTMKGKFIFRVEQAAASTDSSDVATVSPAPQTYQVAAPPSEMEMSGDMPMQQSGVSPFQSVARWLSYMAMMTLFGGFVFLLFVFRPSLAAGSVTDAHSSGFLAAEKRFVQLCGMSLAVLILASIWSLLMQSAAVLDTNIGKAAAPSALYKVLTETLFGPPWVLQAVATVALIIVVTLLATRRSETASADVKVSGNGLLRKPPLWIGLIVSAVLFLTPSLTGHARAAAGEYRFAIFSDWLHLAAAGVWIGGLFQLALMMPKSLAPLDARERLSLLCRVIPRFTNFAITATVLVILTGIYNSWIHVDSFSDLLITSYGNVLVLKVLLFLPMLGLGGVNTFILKPRYERMAERAEPGAVRLDRAFFRSVGIEAALAVLVLLLAAILAFLPPARTHDGMKMESGVFKSFTNREAAARG